MTTQIQAVPEGGDTPSDSHAKRSILPLALGALGVVYGDIGTSPLYALRDCVHGSHALPPSDANILGVLSLMFWSVTLVVTLKYLQFIMRADNEGEGGILALLALLGTRRHARPGRLGVLTGLILFGAALLYGDGILTPAVTVLSAVEGLRVVTDTFDDVVVPLAVAILLGLFAAQRRGTASIGRLFGPVMLVWFGVLTLTGLLALSRHPAVLVGIDPRQGLALFAREPVRAFLGLGAVVLCITGAEALYADMGHFGRRPIQWAWYAVAFPALIINYFGQGALLLAAPQGQARLAIAENPFYALVPTGPLTYALVTIATAAAVIASQALISGAFSLTRQGVQLGYFPRVTIKHTSSEAEGQIYVPLVNWALAGGCIALVVGFGSSSRLAAAYGIAVTGTMVITTIAFFNVARQRLAWSSLEAGSFLAAFLIIDLAFFGANAMKFFDGGYVPIVLAAFIFAVMRTWKRGRELLASHFSRASRPLAELAVALREQCWREPNGRALPIVRTPGVAVFMTSTSDGTPPLVLHHLRHLRSLHERVVLVTVTTSRSPRILDQRYEFTELGEGVCRLYVHSGFMESPDVPRALDDVIRDRALPIDPDDVTYFLGRETLLALRTGEMGRREEMLFAFLSRNAQNATRYFGIPPQRVVEVGVQVDL